MPLKAFYVEERSWVKPIACSDAAVTSVKMEPFDNLAMREGMIQSVTIFPKKLDADAIKSSLARLLSSYPFLAGRARQPLGPFLCQSPAHGWQVRGQKGVAFSVCSATGSAEEAYRELGHDSSKNAYNLVDRRSVHAILWGVAPVMTVRITHFSSGGSALGVAVCGGLMDDYGLQEVLHAWFNGHVHGVWPNPPQLETDRSTCLPSVSPPNRAFQRLCDFFILFQAWAWGIGYLLYFARANDWGIPGYMGGVLLLLLPFIVSFRLDPLQKFLCCFFNGDLHFVYFTLGNSRSMGGTRVRIDLSAQDVCAIVGYSLQEAHCDPTSMRVAVAEAEFLARMAKAVSDIMRFTMSEVQLRWTKDVRGEDRVARSFIGPALAGKTLRVNAGKNPPSLDNIISAFQNLSETQGDLPWNQQFRDWLSTMKTHPQKGWFIQFHEPFITCAASLGASWTMLDSDWGAGKPIGVLRASFGWAKMCEVLPAPEGGVSLYFNLTSISWINSFLAQGTPDGWVQTVQSPEFRTGLLKPVETNGKRSQNARVHPVTESHAA